MKQSYRIAEDDEQIALEAKRLEALTASRDPASFELIAARGIGTGWRCLEIGAGSGTIARFMGECVGETGSVRSIDIDTRFHCEVGRNVEVVQLDVVGADLGRSEFDLVHARAVLQHIAQREALLDRMLAALKPGGVLIVQDSDWTLFFEQEIPEPFRRLVELSMQGTRARHGWDPYVGRRLLQMFRARGLVDVDARGITTTMHGGTPSAEWYVGGLARAKALHVGENGLSEAEFDAAIAQARSPDFAVLSPVSMAAWGRAAGPAKPIQQGFENSIHR